MGSAVPAMADARTRQRFDLVECSRLNREHMTSQWDRLTPMGNSLELGDHWTYPVVPPCVVATNPIHVDHPSRGVRFPPNSNLLSLLVARDEFAHRGGRLFELICLVTV
jgi:hypothetical protein